MQFSFDFNSLKVICEKRNVHRIYIQVKKFTKSKWNKNSNKYVYTIHKQTTAT